MQFRTVFLSVLSTLLLPSFAAAQISNDARAATPIAASAPTAVPALIPYTSTAIAADGKPYTGETSATFLIFKEESGGEPLWVETQMISADKAGQYAVKLGASSPSGVPLEVFANGTARWLEVQIAGQKPQPRVLLATVPYAAKAADAATLGGLPPSAFVLAGSQVAALATAGAGSNVSPDAASTVTTTGGTANYLPKFNAATTIVPSEIFDSGTSVGIGDIPSSSAKLDVNGSMIVRGNTIVARTGNATPSKGFNSYEFAFYANAYNSSTKADDNPHFQMQSEPVGNNTASTSATFNLLYANGGTPVETGFYVNPNGAIHFAPGQTFPGTVSSVGLLAPSDFTVSGSPLTGSGSLGFFWNTPPTNFATANSFVRRDANGGFDGFTINSNLLSTNLLNVGGLAYFGGRLGIGLNNPAAELNLDAGGTANADSLLLGNLQQKGLQLRNNGTGVDIESIGVPLNINFATQQLTYINPNGGQVLVNYNTSGGFPPPYALAVGDTGGLSGYFAGSVRILDDLRVSGSKDFQIDHPLDPANKYLKHAAIESSEVLNQYSGNVVTDGNGSATIQLPEWFGVENIDFRYQLTVIGGRFAQAIISKEIENNQFTISTNAPSVKVSWQVTAKRNDAYMRAHPFKVEEEKPESERGFYDHPELFGQPDEKRTGGPRHLAAKSAGTPVAALKP